MLLNYVTERSNTHILAYMRDLTDCWHSCVVVHPCGSVLKFVSDLN